MTQSNIVSLERLIVNHMVMLDFSDKLTDHGAVRRRAESDAGLPEAREPRRMSFTFSFEIIPYLALKNCSMPFLTLKNFCLPIWP
jgi:hypothetical protein